MPPQDPETARWFATELEPHEDSLRAYLHRQFPAYPEIDDLVQETYARLLRARKTGPLHAPKAFLFTTARNAALDFFRRRKVVAIDPTAEIDLMPVLEERPGVPDSVCNDEEIRLLAEAIQALPERCRQIITLRKIHGLSHREIAAQVGIAENTVNAHLSSGVVRLRDYLRARGVAKDSL